MPYTVCLNMIVKNESHIIIKTLEMLTSKIKFNYWVISDTGSTDNTCDLILNFFANKKIEGELTRDKWIDFGYNRSLALKNAYNKTDYLLVFDADDDIQGNLILPDKPTYDLYEFKFGLEFSYYRGLFVNNRKVWMYKGVLHEFICSIDNCTKTQLDGEYYIISGRTGDRSKDKDKYLKDAKILEKAYETETDNLLKTRYAFYCAQSYKDYKAKEDAIKWYLICLNLDMWEQEKYYSCLSLGNLYMELNKYAEAEKYWLMSCKYDDERIEGVVFLVKQLRVLESNTLINILYNKYKNYNKKLDNKLFLYAYLYEDELEYDNACIAYTVGDLQSGYDCSKQLLINPIINYNRKFLILSSVMYYYKQYINEDSIDNCLELFINVDKLLQNQLNIDIKIIEIWTMLFERVKTKLNIPTMNNKHNIKIVNLEYRTDRKENVIKELTKHNILTYDIINAVDGKKLKPSYQLMNLIKNNNFNNRTGVIGCALSHLFLWKKLIDDPFNQYYIILEDDIELSDDFASKLEIIKNDVDKDIIFIGYHMWSANRNNVINTYDIKNKNPTIHKLNKGLYIGGTFAYVINKNAALKLINYIEKNGIKEPIDNLMLNVQTIDYYESQPLLIFSDWAEKGKPTDTDIQYDYTKLEFKFEDKLIDNFVFIKNYDHFGDDIICRKVPLEQQLMMALTDDNCIGFNTMGYFKHNINKLFKPDCFKENDGIYIKKIFYDKNIKLFNKFLSESTESTELTKSTESTEQNEPTEINQSEQSKQLTEHNEPNESTEPEQPKLINTDFQSELRFKTEDNPIDKFIFIKSYDHFGDDMMCSKIPLEQQLKIALADNKCIGFNTMGYFKNRINKLFKPSCFKENDGIYIKKSFYNNNKSMFDSFNVKID